MNLILRDNARGGRIVTWGIRRVQGGTGDWNRDYERCLQSSLNPAGEECGVTDAFVMETPPPVRPEGVHYIQIGFGAVVGRNYGGSYTQHVVLLVSGSQSVDVSAYGHYPDRTWTSGMAAVDKELPVWSKGGEWTHFVSSLVRSSI